MTRNPVVCGKIYDPDRAASVRKLFCGQYNDCLEEALLNKWSSFSCNKCNGYVPLTSFDEQRDYFGILSMLAESQGLKPEEKTVRSLAGALGDDADDGDEDDDFDESTPVAAKSVHDDDVLCLESDRVDDNWKKLPKAEEQPAVSSNDGSDDLLVHPDDVAHRAQTKRKIQVVEVLDTVEATTAVPESEDEEEELILRV